MGTFQRINKPKNQFESFSQKTEVFDEKVQRFTTLIEAAWREIAILMERKKEIKCAPVSQEKFRRKRRLRNYQDTHKRRLIINVQQDNKRSPRHNFWKLSHHLKTQTITIGKLPKK